MMAEEAPTVVDDREGGTVARKGREQPHGLLVSITQGRPEVTLSLMDTCRHELAKAARRQGRPAPETPVCQTTQACMIIRPPEGVSSGGKAQSFLLMFDDLHRLLEPTHASISDPLIALNVVEGMCTGRDLRGVTWSDPARFLEGEDHMMPPTADTLRICDGMRFSWHVPVGHRICCEAVSDHGGGHGLHAHCKRARRRRCLMFLVVWRTQPVLRAQIGLTEVVPTSAEKGGGVWIRRREVVISSPDFDWRGFLEQFIDMVDRVRIVQSGQ